MSGPISEILSGTKALQAEATNPNASIWVSANAGSGKTYVLSRRVIRLLLEGNKPSELLCLTFTKAAAAEMSNRVFKILSDWSMMDNQELKSAIEELLGRKLSPSLQTRFLERARILFALAMDTPGGLRIQTIHAFCESLLHQFPLEANVPGHFQMMDDLTQNQLLGEARRNVILAGLGIAPKDFADDTDTQNDIREAFDVIRDHGSDAVIEKAIEQLVHQREEFSQWIDGNGGDVYRAMAPVWERFDFSPQTRESDLLDQFADQSAYSDSQWTDLIELATRKKAASYQSLAEAMQEVQSTKEAGDKLALRQTIFLTKELAPRKSLVHKTFLENEPEHMNLFLQEQTILLDQIDRLKTLESLKASEALFLIAEKILIQYGNLKKRNGVLDFNDLIARTANLLSRREISAWIHYKLDSGISHLLVDEAQDTSPLQWQIIQSITAEFYAGKGARDLVRTVFVVGDEKQSIYSFQGADPQEFSRQFHALQEKSKNAKLAFNPLNLTSSFRSTPEVLSAVDQVFSLPENAAGLGLNGGQQVHQANRRSDRGEVFVWPLEIKHKNPEKTDWRQPPDEPTPDDAEIRLAEKIAQTIKDWITTGEHLPAYDRPIRYGDILILVRKRDRFVSAINRALKTRGLAAAGADRLKLTEHIAVEDLMALGRFAYMEMDDLSLASLLKSPIFDFSEEELFAVCETRTAATLFENMVLIGKEKISVSGGQAFISKVRHCVEVLREIQKDAQSLPVLSFYAKLFSRHRLRHKYLSRLGYEVAEILDGFFQAAMDYDNQTGLGIQGFVEGLASSKPELKREIDMERNEIRVITTHSSKGLEAPIVFLVDPGSAAFSTSHAPAVIQLKDAAGASAYLWQGSKEKRISASAEAFEKLEKAAEEEYRRLLYVGMTRAADRLIVCGYRAEGDITHDHWYSMIEKGLSSEKIDQAFNGQFHDCDGGNDPTKIRQWKITNRDFREKPRKTMKEQPLTEKVPLPSWCSLLPADPPAPRPLSPSGVLKLLDIAPEQEMALTQETTTALARGNAVHHLMQILPQADRAHYHQMIDQYFHGMNIGLNETMIEEIRMMVLRMLDAPEGKILFGEGSRAEVEISGEVSLNSRTHLVRGAIDRLAVTNDKVIIADYKTNRSVPNGPSQVSPDYLSQMALYRHLIQQIYPSKTIECMIVWSENGVFMPITDPVLDEQMNLLNKS